MKHSKKVTRSFATVWGPLPAPSVRGCGRALSVLAMIGTVIVAAQSASADQIFADWEADICPESAWTNLFCWGAEPMPNNGNFGDTYVAGISDGNAIVTMNIDITLDGVVIFPSTTLNAMIIQNNRKLTIEGGNRGGVPTGFIDINDLLVMQSTGSFTDLTVVAGPSGSTLIIDSPISPGEIRMSNFSANRIYGATGSETIIFGTDLTVGGSGRIGDDLTTLINEGTIVADQSIELRIDPSTAGGMTNSGTLRAENGAELRLEPGPFTTSGFVFAAAGATIIRVASDYIQTDGSTIVDGALTLNAGGTVTLNGGILGGSGQVNAHVNNVAGTASPGSSPGTLTVNGNYTQGFDASLAIEIGGVKPGQVDVLTVNLTATLGGTLEVTFVDDFEPTVGQQFTILSTDSVVGEFDFIDSCASLSVTYNTTGVVLTITSECPLCPADFDNSGDVGVKDLLFLLGAWGPCPPKGDCLADFDDTGDVGVKDLLFLLGAWGPCP